MAERNVQQAQQARDELRRVVGYSVADEITKLDQLKKSGAITDDEFASQCQTRLASGAVRSKRCDAAWWHGACRSGMSATRLLSGAEPTSARWQAAKRPGAPRALHSRRPAPFPPPPAFLPLSSADQAWFHRDRQAVAKHERADALDASAPWRIDTIIAEPFEARGCVRAGRGTGHGRPILWQLRNSGGAKLPLYFPALG